MNAINLLTYKKRVGIHTPIYDRDFNATGSNVAELRQQEGVNPDDWKIYNDETELNLPEVDQKYWKTVNRYIVEMSSSEKSAIDTAEVDSAKISKISAIKASANSTILNKYPDWKQRNYTGSGVGLLTKLVEGGTLTAEEIAEREAIEGMSTWIKGIRDQSDIMEIDVNSMTSVSSIQAYNIYFSV
jgi:hypothetical protein